MGEEQYLFEMNNKEEEFRFCDKYDRVHSVNSFNFLGEGCRKTYTLLFINSAPQRRPDSQRMFSKTLILLPYSSLALSCSTRKLKMKFSRQYLMWKAKKNQNSKSWLSEISFMWCHLISKIYKMQSMHQYTIWPQQVKYAFGVYIAKKVSGE